MKKPFKLGLLPKIIIAIILGLTCSLFMPDAGVRFFVTINSIFSNFLGFAIPLIILGLVAPGIADLGTGAGKLLGYTTLIAYTSTICAGFFSYLTCRLTFPFLLPNGAADLTAETANQASGFSTPALEVTGKVLEPFFTVAMPPLMDVVSALIMAFILGLGLAAMPGRAFKDVLNDFAQVINMVISKVIIPVLPLYIFGIFLKMGAEGQAATIMSLFAKVIVVIFGIYIVWLTIQFTIAGIIAKKNPFKLLKTMLPAYMTALGTQSSAATIPVTLKQAIKTGANPDLAGFVVPLCATIHLAGSILEIVACSMAILWMTPDTLPITFPLYVGFIMMLGITMVAAPGVPGGAVMAALGLLASILLFNADLQGLMIALYIALDSFGTASNVTGDGAITTIMDKIYSRMKKKEAAKNTVTA